MHTSFLTSLQLRLTLTASYRKHRDNLSLLPYVSLINEHFLQDSTLYLWQTNSNGDILLRGMGVDISISKDYFVANRRTPFHKRWPHEK